MKETLKKLRTANRYSQDLLAKILGVSRLSYMKYESGEVEPSVEIVRKLSKIYKVSYKAIIDNEFCNVDLDMDKDNAEMVYDYAKSEIAVASPVPSYGDSEMMYSYADNNQAFASILFELNKTVSSMKEQLDTLTKQMNPNDKYKKSESFDKDKFFKKIGSVNMDSSYIDELRGESLV